MGWVDMEEREAASAKRESASLSEMKVSEKMTSYYDFLVNASGLVRSLGRLT